MGKAFMKEDQSKSMDFKERFFQRIASVLNLTSPPIEPLVYTKEEFEEMKHQSFILEVLKKAKEL